MSDDPKKLRRLAIHAITVRSEDVPYGEVLRRERAYQDAVRDPWVVIRLIDERDRLRETGRAFLNSYHRDGNGKPSTLGRPEIRKALAEFEAALEGHE